MLFPPLTTWSLTWIHRLFFLTAATPVVKVFLMLVARRRASWELPSRPAMEPDSTVAPLARPINSPLMFFLWWQKNELHLNACTWLTGRAFFLTTSGSYWYDNIQEANLSVLVAYCAVWKPICWWDAPCIISLFHYGYWRSQFDLDYLLLTSI